MADALGDLYTCDDEALWQHVLDQYEAVLQRKAEQIKSKDKRAELIQLDQWYQKEWPRLLESRPEKVIERKELVQLTRWKLVRGQFRPQLLKLVESNDEGAVKDASKKAFSALPDLAAAIEALSVLKGVGPATASGVLCAGAPHVAPFMADESMLAIPSCRQLQYTPKRYLVFAKEVQQLTQRLDRASHQKGFWTAHKVELALWTQHVANKLGMQLGSADKRKAEQDTTSSKRTRKEQP